MREKAGKAFRVALAGGAAFVASENLDNYQAQAGTITTPVVASK